MDKRSRKSAEEKALLTELSNRLAANNSRVRKLHAEIAVLDAKIVGFAAEIRRLDGERAAAAAAAADAASKAAISDRVYDLCISRLKDRMMLAAKNTADSPSAQVEAEVAQINAENKSVNEAYVSKNAEIRGEMNRHEIEVDRLSKDIEKLTAELAAADAARKAANSVVLQTECDNLSLRLRHDAVLAQIVKSRDE